MVFDFAHVFIIFVLCRRMKMIMTSICGILGACTYIIPVVVAEENAAVYRT